MYKENWIFHKKQGKKNLKNCKKFLQKYGKTTINFTRLVQAQKIFIDLYYI